MRHRGFTALTFLVGKTQFSGTLQRSGRTHWSRGKANSFVCGRTDVFDTETVTFRASIERCHSLLRLTFSSPSAGKGGKNRRRGKNENETEKRELVFKEDGQEYAQVIKMLGNGRLEAMCFDGMKRLCHIRGKLRKKVWINQGDIILVGLRDYQDAKADVILKYNPDEARNLKSYGELPEHAKINDTVNFGEEEEDDNIEFDEVSGDEDIEGI